MIFRSDCGPSASLTSTATRRNRFASSRNRGSRNSFRFSYGLGFVYDRNFADKDTFFAQEQLKTRRRAEAEARGLPYH